MIAGNTIAVRSTMGLLTGIYSKYLEIPAIKSQCGHRIMDLDQYLEKMITNTIVI